MPHTLVFQEQHVNIGGLQPQLPPDILSASRERFRTFPHWAAQQVPFANEILSLFQRANAYSTPSKVILVVALLSGRKLQTMAVESAGPTMSEEHVSGVPAIVSHAVVEATLQHGPRPSPTPPRKLYKLEGIPHNLQLFGRQCDLEHTFDLLTKRTDGHSSTHVVLVGLGGIGKTSLATAIAHDSRSRILGLPVFIRCERLDTLDAFLWSLLRLRAPESLKPGENLAQAVLFELSQGPLFLILDNLLDSTDASHESYLDFIDSITSIPTLTLLITSRNHEIINRSASRPIADIQLDGLSVDAAEDLFRNVYGRVESDWALEKDEPDMEELLGLLDGIPLAIVLVAAHARTAQSLADVIRRWKDGRAWHNGAHGRLSSLKSPFATTSVGAGPGSAAQSTAPSCAG
ncbi:hypothetical protein RQP46_011042 [Phenoliferia psychrophenolica]